MERAISEFTEYDFIVLIDKSGSMGAPAVGPGKQSPFANRWAQAKELAEGVASFAAQVDDDGITLIKFGGTFNPSTDIADGVQAAAVSDIFAKHFPGGGTPLHSALDAAFAKHFSSPKKTIVVIFTDGVPDDKNAVVTSIIGAAGKLESADRLRLLFVQVGDDPTASAFLNDLDNHLTSAKFDIVNAISSDVANGLTVPQLMDRTLDDSH